MHPLYERFLSFLDKDDRFGCVDFVLTRLQNNVLDIVTLYDEILAPSLRESFCREKQKAICVWEEHVRSSIIRTVIECCYPYVVKERAEKYRSAPKGKVIVVCPPEELHEIGARMVADFFTLCGFDAVFVGANTPQTEILEAIDYERPKYIAISVSNYYNLVIEGLDLAGSHAYINHCSPLVINLNDIPDPEGRDEGPPGAKGGSMATHSEK